MIGLNRLRLAALLPLVLVAPIARAQSTTNVAQQAGWNPQQILKTETYVRPPSDVERIIMAPRTDITFSAPSLDRKWFLKSNGTDRGDVIAYGKPHVYLGGIVIDTTANRSRALTTSTRQGLVLVDPRTNATRMIETPKGASISAQSWSPNGTQIAYIANFETAWHLFVADAATGKSTQLTKTPLLA